MATWVSALGIGCIGLAACRRENNARPGLPNPGPGEANDGLNSAHSAGKAAGFGNPAGAWGQKQPSPRGC
jgi:hypothetical protein